MKKKKNSTYKHSTFLIETSSTIANIIMEEKHLFMKLKLKILLLNPLQPLRIVEKNVCVQIEKHNKQFVQHLMFHTLHNSFIEILLINFLYVFYKFTTTHSHLRIQNTI